MKLRDGARWTMLGVAVMGVAVAMAGPLDPPSGPISPTYRTLLQVEPRTPITALPYNITQPGSYYLTGNLTCLAGWSGINIISNNVTIDLNGFMLEGNGGTGVTAIYCGGRNNVTVRNGSILNWNRHGIDAQLAHSVRIENVQIDSCAGQGIFGGFTMLVSGCSARNCSSGIIVADTSCVSSCNATACQVGFQIGSGSTVSDCVSGGNSGDGFDAATGVTMRGCTARGNGITGFVTGAAASIAHCTSQGNHGKGFQMDGAGELVDSTSSGNVGIGVDIFIPNGTPLVAKVTGCTINFNAGHGLAQAGGGGSTFSGNTIARNSGAGILLQDGNVVQNNHILDNGQPAVAAGIQVNGSVNTIEGNQMLNNGVMYSFAVGTANNNFYGNTCSGGARFNSGANNIAPFVSAGTAFAGGSLANSNPFVNIQY